MSGFFYGGEVPDHVREQLEQMVDHHRMHVETSQHDIMRLFDEQNKDNLRTLAGIFALLGGNGAPLGHYFNGLAVAYLKLKFDVCAACGETHAAEQILQNEPPKPAAEPAADITAHMPADVLRGIELAARKDLMTRYRVNEVPESDAVVCQGCDTVYPSLEDRMLKKPDECHGCIQKTKWG